MVPKHLGLGAIVWWSLPDSIPVSREEWPYRFPDFLMVAEPLGDPLRRALFALQAPEGSKRLVRPLKDKNHWAVVIETPTIDDDLNYSTAFTIQLSTDRLEFIRQSGNLSWNYMLEDNYKQELQRITSTAVADLILSHVRGQCLAVQARKTGGVYFVPQDHSDELEKIVQLVEALGGRLFYFPVEDKERERKDLLHLVVEDLKSAMELVRANLDNRHKADAIKEGKLALDRVRFYREALGLVTEEAGNMEKEINEMLVGALTKGKSKQEVQS